MNAFLIAEAKWRGLEQPNDNNEARWIIRGRALVDIQVGTRLMFGDRLATVEVIQTYGKEIDILSSGMTGELLIRWETGGSWIYLNQ